VKKVFTLWPYTLAYLRHYCAEKNLRIKPQQPAQLQKIAELELKMLCWQTAQAL